MTCDGLPLEGLTVSMDRREGDMARWAYIRGFCTMMGATTKPASLNDYDYLIEGTYRGVDVKIGIEYKRLDDLISSIMELPERFARAFGHTNDVALFIEGQIRAVRHLTTTETSRDGNVIHTKIGLSKYTFVENINTEGMVGEVLQYNIYQSKLAQFQEAGVQVRQFDELVMLGDNILNLLSHYVPTKPHPYLKLVKPDYRRERFFWYQSFPGIGAGTALLLSAHNLTYWLDHPDELLSIAKPSKTKKILDFIGAT